MGWNEVEEKLGKYVDLYAIPRYDGFERAMIRQCIKEEFPYLTDEDIDHAIDECTRLIRTPVPQVELLACIQRRMQAG